MFLQITHLWLCVVSSSLCVSYRVFQVACFVQTRMQNCKVSRDLNPPIESKLSRDNLDSIGGFKSCDTFAVLHSDFFGQPT